MSENEIAQLKESIIQLTRAVEVDAENIRRLANIAAAREDRLDELESPE